MAEKTSGQSQSLTGDVVREEPSLGDRLRLFGAIGIVAVLGIFLVQNLDDAEVNFLWMELNVPLIFALLAAAVLGALMTIVVGFFRGRRAAARLKAEFAREEEK